MNTRFVSDSPLVSVARVAADFELIPDKPGVYAWFFRALPPRIGNEHCLVRRGRTLLYVGIAPRFRRSGKDRTRTTLRTRIRYHLTGNLSGSTLRHSLASLLRGRLRLHAEQRASGGITLADHESRLTKWICENAYLCWVVHPQPWKLEDAMMSHYQLPLNLAGNPSNPYKPLVSRLRKELRTSALLRA